MLALDNKLAYLTYHAYSEFIIYPYSSSYSAEAHNKGELDMVASMMVKNIQVRMSSFIRTHNFYKPFVRTYMVKSTDMVKAQMHFIQPLEVPMIGVIVKRTLTCHLQLNCVTLELMRFYFPKIN